MNAAEHAVSPVGTLNAAARERLLSNPREPLFIADWLSVLMIHFEVDADELQRDVPFELDLRDGRAFVSLVAFTMRGMRPGFGGKLGALLLRPIATHHFFNVRTYVRHLNENGIYFLAEWLSNWFAVKLGPKSFGLPYRYGEIVYQHDLGRGDFRGHVVDAATGAALKYRSGRREETLSLYDNQSHSLLVPSPQDSLTEWLMERYTAFTCNGSQRRFFRIWHLPWPQCEVGINLTENSLLKENWAWFSSAQLIGANYSPGVRGVLMGWPRQIRNGGGH